MKLGLNTSMQYPLIPFTVTSNMSMFGDTLTAMSDDRRSLEIELLTKYVNGRIVV
jgi:hypothetical protein